MTDANYNLGENFRVQFVWRIPEGDFIRAMFNVEVLLLDSLSQKYVLQLTEFLAGRQESGEGILRLAKDSSHSYWQLVSELVGRRISLSYEVDDGRPLWLRLETLTGEHSFFRRLDGKALDNLLVKKKND